MKLCKVTDCARKHNAKGYCNTHYQQYYRYGNPLIRKARSHEKHGMERSREYAAWLNMKQRCLNPKNIAWHNYGGRGIAICEQWLNSFVIFYKDMGECPPKLTLERIDVNGNYEPSNCEWVTYQQQSINQRIRKDNTSGFKGVWFDKKRDIWSAYISRNHKRMHLGYFKTQKEAIESRLLAEVQL